MNTKGFTLVELLAVIIILALLTLLASTSVTKLVKDSKEELSNTQIELIKSAAQMWGADNIDKLPSSGQCGYITLGELKEYGFLDSSIVDANTNKEISNDLKIKITGTTSDFGNLVLNYEVNPESVDGCSQLNVNKKYENGEVVYFNVSTGKQCTNYIESQSNTGVKEGCMKFYAFNDSERSDTVKLLLDHNTTVAVGYEDNSVSSGDALTSLKTDTNLWIGTIEQTQLGNNYKARLITAEEISKIIGFDLGESPYYNNYYFDSKTSEQSSTCTVGNTTGCEYGWLNDRTSTICTSYGCLNNSDIVTDGYWTSTYYYEKEENGYAYDYDLVWKITEVSSLVCGQAEAFGSSDLSGVRPVIEVSKKKLS